MNNDTLTSPKSHYITDSRGKLYLRKLVKLVSYVDKNLQRQTVARFQNLRCLPDGSILPRIRMSKKDRLKLKLALQCSAPSSKNSSAPAPFTSPA